jgi:hypothetical protein
MRPSGSLAPALEPYRGLDSGNPSQVTLFQRADGRGGVRFATDSALERAGFEPWVPHKEGQRFLRLPHSTTPAISLRDRG